MKKYKIQQKLITPAKIMQDMITYKGFTFEPYDTEEPWRAGKLLVSAIINAEDGKTALPQYDDELIPILDALSVVSQCSVSLVLPSIMLYRLEPKADCAYVACRIPRDTVGMALDDESFVDIEKLCEAQDPSIFYLREANNSVTPWGRLVMLLSAAEALAGSIQRQRKCQNAGCGAVLICPTCGEKAQDYPATNQDRLKEICGDSLYRKIYRGSSSRGPLRHKLAHGGRANREEAGIVNDFHACLLNYLKQKKDLVSLDKILSGPRTLNTSKKEGRVFVRTTDGEYNLPDIEKELVLLFDNEIDTSNLVEIVSDPPDTETY